MKFIQLALKNLFSGGIRPWLNVFVLSMAYVMIIWSKGLLGGWDKQATFDMINWEIGDGQFWHKNYDPFDLFSIQESHAKITGELQHGVQNKQIVPILISQGTIYPEGRIQSVLLKGIQADQELLRLPTYKLISGDNQILPVIIGKRMAKNNKLSIGDIITIRWRDVHGTFDATEVEIADVFDCNVPMIDMNQIWLNIEDLQQMKQLPGEATILVKSPEFSSTVNNEWVSRDLDFLLSEIKDIIKMKTVGQSIFYLFLLLLALLAIFDTQVLAIFRRQREIGTMIALGMTRLQVVTLFTIEGAMHAILAAFIGALYGIPLLWQQATSGFTLPGNTDDYGMATADVIYPEYSIGLIIGTILIITLSTTIVSFLPARRISKLNPTEAIKGKLQ